MCKLIDDYAKEKVNEATYKENISNIRNLFVNNGSLELAITTFKNVSEETIRKIYEEVTGSKSLV